MLSPGSTVIGAVKSPAPTGPSLASPVPAWPAGYRQEWHLEGSLHQAFLVAMEDMPSPQGEKWSAMTGGSLPAPPPPWKAKQALGGRQRAVKATDAYHGCRDCRGAQGGPHGVSSPEPQNARGIM